MFKSNQILVPDIYTDLYSFLLAVFIYCNACSWTISYKVSYNSTISNTGYVHTYPGIILVTYWNINLIPTPVYFSDVLLQPDLLNVSDTGLLLDLCSSQLYYQNKTNHYLTLQYQSVILVMMASMYQNDKWTDTVFLTPTVRDTYY